MVWAFPFPSGKRSPNYGTSESLMRNVKGEVKCKPCQRASPLTFRGQLILPLERPKVWVKDGAPRPFSTHRERRGVGIRATIKGRRTLLSEVTTRVTSANIRDGHSHLLLPPLPPPFPPLTLKAAYLTATTMRNPLFHATYDFRRSGAVITLRCHVR